MAASTTKHTQPAKLNWWRKKSILIPLIILAVIGLGIWGVADFLFRNRAADIAAPLEGSLMANGATKLCGDGDPGRGPDNDTAYYRSYFDVHLSKDDAIALMYRVAKDNGYNLTHASQSNRGHLGAVGDNYIDRWYFDDSKQQSYGDMEAGPIKLAFTVDGPGPSTYCRADHTILPGHTLISFGIQLPSFKQLSSNSHIDFSR